MMKSLFTFLAIFCLGYTISYGQTGTSLYDAIPITANTCSGGTFTDYQYTPNFNDTYGHNSPDVWYTFTLTSTTNVNITTCGSDFDTYLRLFLGGNNEIITDDDGGCGNNTSSISMNLNPGTYFLAAEGYGVSSGTLKIDFTFSGIGMPSAGSGLTNAISAGTFSNSGTFTDTRNNADPCLGNYIGHFSNDIFYTFTLNNTANVTLAHCGSNFDTSIHLLDASGNEINNNDDSSLGPCPGTQAYLETTLSPGIYYVVSEGYGSYTGSIVTSITVSMSGNTCLPVISYSNQGHLSIGNPVNFTPVNTGGAVISGGQITSTFVGSSANLNNPIGLASDAIGNIYIAEAGNHAIRKVSPSGSVSTLAGIGYAGYQDGVGTSAIFRHPTFMAVDGSGNLFVADQQNHRIRKISPSGVVTTFAGSGSIGSADGYGVSASFQYPMGLAFDAAWNLYVADAYNHKIRKITPTGLVSTYAGTGSIGASNGPAASASFQYPMNIVVDVSGNLFVTDRFNYMIRKIDPSGNVITFAGNGAAGSTNGIGTAASFNRPNGLTIDASGNLYVAEDYNNMVRKITPTGVVTTLAGNLSAGSVDGTGSTVSFTTPYGICSDAQGNIFVTENSMNRVRKITIINGYSISPALPPGLAFNENDGSITGIPTAVSPLTSYMVTAYSSCGTGSTVISLQVAADANASLNYVSTKSYDDDGIMVNESKTFYSDNGKTIQSQIKNISSNQVLASEVLYDALGRAAGSTLAAPINSAELNYKSNFVTNASGYKYDYRNFDGSKTNAPDAVGNTSIGTLGWYYSNNNTFESYVPSTSYPYSRTTFYNDGIGGVKKQASVGEVHKMGTGYQNSSNAMGVVHELDFYNELRSKFFSEAEIGSRNALVANGMIDVVQDVNGSQDASITDLEGRVLMTAKAGASTGLTVSNIVSISNQAGYEYEVNWKENGVSLSYTPYIRVNGDYIEVFKSTNDWLSSVSLYSGLAAAYNSSGSTEGRYKIVSSTPFTTTYQVPANNLETSVCKGCHGKLSSEGKVQIHYFRLYNTTSVSITGTGWKLYNMSDDEQEVATSGSSFSLSKGYYKVSIPQTGNATISYSNIYSDISYNFYNQLGQLVGSVAPEGVKAIVNNGLGSYATFGAVPFSSTYEYDTRGRAIASNNTDAGRTEFIYRKDGRIRFSQNSLQRIANPKRFSYVNYDQWGRSIESGEFVETGTNTFVSAKTDIALQENLGPDGGLTGGTKQEWVKTYYDEGNSSHGVPGYGNQDEFALRGAVSWTENAAGSKTWYNYNGEGQVVWVVRVIPGLGNKTIDYTYDSRGNVFKVDFQKNVAAERFVHEYEYDADNRLNVVYTTAATSGRKLQAKYYYYLHGPLKRVELGNNLQGIDYVYTPQGMLKSINHPVESNDPGRDGVANSFSPDVFGQTLEYFNGDYTRSGTNISALSTGGVSDYSGNIMGQSWRSQKPNSVVATYGTAVNNPAMVTYAYDDKYQFDNNKFGAPNFGSNSFTEALNANREYGLSYDANGNIASLNRTNAAGATIASFGYSYLPNTNKLAAVSNYASYAYDELGQMNGQIRTAGAGYYLSYDVNGKVTAIYSNPEKSVLRVSFGYDETGNKIRKTDHILNTTTYYIYDPSGNMLSVYDDKGSSMQQKELPVYAGSRLGIYNKQSNNYHYELTDHLGNVRVVINEAKQGNGTADVVYYSDYYPYGSPLTLANNDYRFGYQGQYAEADKETGWNNFDLRMYDPSIGRWMSTDPAGQYYSPYVGMGNNPVSSIDPDGGYDWWHGFTKWVGSGFKGKFKEAESGDRKGQYYISRVVEDNAPGQVNIIRSLDFGNGDHGGQFYPNGTITSFHPDLITRWSLSDNFVAQLSYKTIDNFYLGFGSLIPGSPQNHFNGQSSLPNERIGAFINASTSVFPFGKSIQLLPKLNTAEFSFVVKGTMVARLQPAARGMILKISNKISSSLKVTTVVKSVSNKIKKQIDSHKSDD